VNAFAEDPTSESTKSAGPSGVAPERASVEHSSGQEAGAERDLGAEIRIKPFEANVPLIGVPLSPVLEDPAWNALDIVRLTVLTIISLFLGVFAALFLARWLVYPHTPLGDLARVPLVIVAGQALAYVLILGYMFILVTRERHRPDFLAAIHWNWPESPSVYLLIGIALSVALQILASRLPIPKNLPIDTFFRTSTEAWALTIFGIVLAPLMEELFFRGFLYPVLKRGMGLTLAIFFTAVAFALLHGSQLMFSWGPVLVIFLVGLVLTTVRAKTNSVSAGLLIHIAYNGTISALMFFATDGFRHLEKLNQ
jgi:uncharacterized protein